MLIFLGSKENQPSMPPSEDCLYLNVFVPDLLVSQLLFGEQFGKL